MNLKQGLILSSAFMLMALVVSCTNTPTFPGFNSPTFQLSGTATRKPSPTFKPTRTTTPTWTPSPTSSPQPTELSGLIKQYDCFPYYGKSPSGVWLFFTCHYFNNLSSGSSLVLYNQASGRTWEYQYCEFDNGCDTPDDDLLGSIYPKAWSPDGKYLYATMRQGGDGGLWFYIVDKILRIDLNTGKAIIYISAMADYSFSPSGKQLAYITWYWDKPLVLIVRNLENSSEVKFTLESKYRQAGNIAWSPDESHFAFIALTCEYDNLPPFSVMMVDVISPSRVILVNDYPDRIFSITWRSDEVLELLDDRDKPAFFFEISSRQLTALPTRTPTRPFFTRDPITPNNTD